MRYLLTFLFFILVTSNAYAGELDGKYLKCPSIQPSDQKTPLYLKFSKPTVFYITITGDKASYYRFGSYSLGGVHKIYVAVGSDFSSDRYIGSHLHIDRRTLKISNVDKELLGECSVSSKEQAETEIESYIKQAKKKNKF